MEKYCVSRLRGPNFFVLELILKEFGLERLYVNCHEITFVMNWCYINKI